MRVSWSSWSEKSSQLVKGSPFNRKRVSRACHMQCMCHAWCSSKAAYGNMVMYLKVHASRSSWFVMSPWFVMSSGLVMSSWLEKCSLWEVNVPNSKNIQSNGYYVKIQYFQIHHSNVFQMYTNRSNKRESSSIGIARKLISKFLIHYHYD